MGKKVMAPTGESCYNEVIYSDLLCFLYFNTALEKYPIKS